eukprot:gene4206-3038_t
MRVRTALTPRAVQWMSWPIRATLELPAYPGPAPCSPLPSRMANGEHKGAERDSTNSSVESTINR